MPDAERSLLEYLDSPQLTCLNESDEHQFKPIVADKKRNTGSAYLLSDTDEQLLLSIPFNQAVQIRAIALQTRENVAQGPRTIRLLINRPSLGFDDVEDGHSKFQQIELTEEDVMDGKKIPLKVVNYQTVYSLHIFVVSNQGGEDVTRIDSIEVFGTPVMGTRDVSGLKRVEDE